MRVASPSNMARILITGHDGFTGQFLWKDLQEKGHEPLALSLDGQPVDLRDAPTVQQALRQLAPHKIIHLAAISSVDHGDVKQIYDVNLLGTRNLLEACTQLDRAIEAVILASSANIYGNQSGQMTEASPVQPANDYAVSKLAMEYMAQLWQHKLPIVIARPFNYTGIGQSTNFLIPKIVSHFVAKKELIELGNLDVWREFNDVRDVTHAYAKLIEAAPVGKIINVCSGNLHSLREVLELTATLTGHTLDIKVNPDFVRPNEVISLGGDPSLLRQYVADWSPHPLSETLQCMLT